MDQFLSPWVYLAFLAVPVLLAWRLVRLPKSDGWLAAERSEAPGSVRSGTASGGPSHPTVATGPTRPWQYPAALGLVALGIAMFAFWFHWQPVGRKLDGRVMFVERHSTWSPTMPPYSTTRFGEEGSYNYAAIYDYCSQFFGMSRLLESDPINDEKLSTCDVLVIKIPTAAYKAEEVQAVVRFVERGGGLLLIGDHTNYEKSSSYMNRITEHFGFKYRHDLLFYIGDPYFQPYEPPAVPHPVVQRVPPMSFAVSCSIDPGHSLGQAVIRSTGLWNLPPDYRRSNWHPEPEYHTEMRYGAFIQLWATTHGAGRVLAWTDSTIFSSFCTFQPGKSELLLGMLDWLNHRSMFDRAWLRFALTVAVCLAALAMVAIGLRWAWTGRVWWLAVGAAGLLGWIAGCAAVVATHRVCLPPPEKVAPGFHVVIDRTVSDAPLSIGAYNERPEGHGLRAFRAVDRAIGLLHRAPQRPGGFRRRHGGRHLPAEVRARGIPRGAGGLRGRRRQAPGDRLSEQRRLHGQQPLVAAGNERQPCQQPRGQAGIGQRMAWNPGRIRVRGSGGDSLPMGRRIARRREEGAWPRDRHGRRLRGSPERLELGL